MATTIKLGATGDYPQGKLNSGDEGELRFAIGHKDGKVIIDFGKSVSWIGFDPDSARQFAEMLVYHATKTKEDKEKA